MPLMTHQDMADIAAALDRLLPDGKAFAVVVVEQRSSEPVQVFGNLRPADQARLLLEGADAIASPAEQSITKPRKLA